MSRHVRMDGIPGESIPGNPAPHDSERGKPKSFWAWLAKPAPHATLKIIAWWETRRVIYNLLMLPAGIAGLMLVMVMISLRWPTPGPGVSADEHDFVPFIAAILGGFGANLCYTGGWMAEILARRFGREKASHIGPILWTLGTLFSIGVCFLPGILHLAVWILTGRATK